MSCIADLSALWCWSGGTGISRKLSLYYTIVYYYNGAQSFEQFLHVGRLYQALILLSLALTSRCLTLSNPVPWQNWMVAYLGYTLRMRTLFRGWPIMVNDTHTRRRRRRSLALYSEHLCVVFGLHGAIYFCLHPSLYLLVSWAWWDWPMMWLTNHRPSVLWRCWLDHLTRKIVPKMTYTVSSVMLNPIIPYQCFDTVCWVSGRAFGL